MPTTIRALAKFSNERYLYHLDGATIETGDTADVVDHYAHKLRKRGLVEIVEDAEANDADSSEAGTDKPAADDPSVVDTEDEQQVPAAEWTLGESAGAGFYYARYDGERVEDDESRSGYHTVGRGKDDAQAEIDRRNDEQLTPADVLSA